MQTPEQIRDDLEKGDVINYQFTDEDGETISLTGTVCKSNRGGVRVLPSTEHTSLSYAKWLHTLKCGHASKVNRDGGSLRQTYKMGSDPRIEKTGETAGVEYVLLTGWVHREQEEA